MGIAGLIIGILSLIGMAVAFIPFLGFLNWFNIPFALIGLALSITGIALDKERNPGIAGAILCSFAITVGAFRLIIGFGIL